VKVDAKDPQQMAALQAQAAARRRSVLINNLVMVVHVDDQVWRYEGGRGTARHTAALRAALRDEPWVEPVDRALNYLVVNAPAAPADIVAQVVFLARLQQGERVTLDEVLDSIPSGAAIWVDLPEKMPDLDEEVAFPDPPPSGDGSKS
jgi:hypothetical protein